MHVGCLAVDRLLLGGELVGVGVARGGIELVGHAARRMIDAVAQGHHREDQQGRDLNHVDGDVDRRGAVDAAMGDVGNTERRRRSRPAIMNIGPGLEALMKLGQSVPAR